MTPSEMKVLIAAEDGDQTAAVAAHVAEQLPADLTIVDDWDEVISLVQSGGFDVVLASDHIIPDQVADEIDWTSEACDPVLFVFGKRLTVDRTIAALRCGAIDVIRLPDDLERLAPAVRQCIQERTRVERERNRALRLRRLSSDLIRDRRELRQRVDLICRDVVTAYRRLAEKTVSQLGNMPTITADPDSSGFDA